jgi:hypothetical protein
MRKQDPPDPLIDEVRAVRRRIWEEHGNDIGRVIEHYMEYEKQFSDNLISPPPSETPEEDKSAAA